MNRRAEEHPLLYEIIGLLVFGVVSLVWFGGLEALIGGFQDKAMNSFNQIISAVKTQCNGGNSSLLTGLDLGSASSTYIITQLNIPGAYRNDPDTMGFIQPGMRKCVDANCLCLLELKEKEGNWQACITSDFDSWNFDLGAILGPPGCPFWYYAPPDVTTMAVQGVLDLLTLDGMDLILGWLPNAQDPTEYYVFPAPQTWGGCSGTTENNLLITSFTNSKATFNCDKIKNVILGSFGFSNINYARSELMKRMNLTPISSSTSVNYLNDLTKTNFIDKVNNSVVPIIKSSFFTILDNEFSEDYNKLVINKLVQNTTMIGGSVSLNSLKTNGYEVLHNLKEGYNQTIHYLLSEAGFAKNNIDENMVSSCLTLMLNNVTATIDEIALDNNVIAKEVYSGMFRPVQAFQNASLLVNYNNSPENINSITVSVLAINDFGNPSLKVSINECSQTQLITDEFQLLTYSFKPSCINDSLFRIVLQEASNSDVGSMGLVRGHDSRAVSLFNDGSNEIIESTDFAVNVTFSEKHLNNEFTDYVIGEVSLKAVNKAFQGTSYGDVDTYASHVSNVLSSFDLSAIPGQVYNEINSYYVSLFNTLLNEYVYLEQEGECNQVLFPNINVTESLTESNSKLKESLNNLLDYRFNYIPNLDVSINSVSTLDFSTINASPVLQSFSQGLADEEYAFINQTLRNCLNINFDELESNDYINYFISNTTSAFNKTLQVYSQEIIDSMTKTSSGLPESFDFSETFKTYSSSAIEVINRDFSNYASTIIFKGVSSTSSFLLYTVSNWSNIAWEGDPYSAVNCWPRVYTKESVCETGTTNKWFENNCYARELLCKDNKIIDGLCYKSTPINIDLRDYCESKSGSWYNNKCYFTAYPSVNDLLGWRRYISVSRLEPAAAALAIKGIGKVGSAILKSAIKYTVNVKYPGNEFIDQAGNLRWAASVDDAQNTINAKYEYDSANIKLNNWIEDNPGYDSLDPEFIELSNAASDAEQALAMNWIFTVPLSILGNDYQGIIPSKTSPDYSAITGNFNWNLLKLGLKRWVFNNKKILTLALKISYVGFNVGINLWKNTVLTKLATDEVKYIDGGIRTFDPQLINVRSCVRMDELGCKANDAVWVNESFYCQTELFVRRMASANQWINFLKGNDACKGKSKGEGSSVNNGEWYKDTLTTCYKLSCDLTGPAGYVDHMYYNLDDPEEPIDYNSDRYHVFQYWIGQSGDPAGIFGETISGSINLLKVYNSTIPGLGNRIIMEVLGGDESKRIPPSAI